MGRDALSARLLYMAGVFSPSTTLPCRLLSPSKTYVLARWSIVTFAVRSAETTTALLWGGGTELGWKKRGTYVVYIAATAVTPPFIFRG